MKSDRKVAGKLVIYLTTVSATFGCPGGNVSLSDAAKTDTESFIIQKGVTLPKLWHECLDVHPPWMHQRQMMGNVRFPPVPDIRSMSAFDPLRSFRRAADLVDPRQGVDTSS
jgi:hypothetical protein